MVLSVGPKSADEETAQETPHRVSLPVAAFTVSCLGRVPEGETWMNEQ
jgi:hypothetical protein